MAKYDELPVYKASYDLLLEIFKFTKEFKPPKIPKKMKNCSHPHI
jgi:hypothetical protein